MAGRGRSRGGPEEGSDEYAWLYGEGSSSTPEDEATRLLPTTPRPGRESSRRPAHTPPPPSPPPARPGPPPAQPRQRRPRRGRVPRRRPRWLLVLVTLWLAFLLAVPLWAWTQVSTVDATPAGDRPAEQPGTTYLLVGSDSRQDLSPEQRRELGTGAAGGQRTDTIMLLHTGDGPNLLLSVPRDSLVDVPGRGTSKINAAYAVGGAPLLVRTLEQETGIRIDKYVEIGFGGFAGIVDALGGVEICPEKALRDKDAALRIEAGCQEADGKTALGFARTRKTQDLGDIGRAANQREVVSAIGDEALSPWTVLNPVRYFRFAGASAGALTVGEETGPVALAKFALAMTRVDGENGLTCGVPIADLAVTWDPERAPEMFSYIAGDDTASIPPSLCTPSGMPQ